MYLDDNVMANLQIHDFNNIADFRSQLFCLKTGDDSTLSTALQLLYDQTFKNFDYQTKFTEGMNEIMSDYAQDTKKIEYTSCNQFWLMTSFDPGVIFEFREKKAIINYKTGMYDTIECGKKAWSELQDAVNHYDILYSKYAEYLDFDQIDIVAFADSTDTRLWEFDVRKDLNQKWETVIANYPAKFFEAGVKGFNIAEPKEQSEPQEKQSEPVSETKETLTEQNETEPETEVINAPLKYTADEDTQQFIEETFTWVNYTNNFVGWKIKNPLDKTVTMQFDIYFKNADGQVIDTWVDQWQAFFPESEGVMYAFTQKEYDSVEFKAIYWDADYTSPINDDLMISNVDDAYTFKNASDKTMFFPSVSIIFKKGDNWIGFSENQIYTNGIEFSAQEEAYRNVYIPEDSDSIEIYIDGGYK